MKDINLFNYFILSFIVAIVVNTTFNLQPDHLNYIIKNYSFWCFSLLTLALLTFLINRINKLTLEEPNLDNNIVFGFFRFLLLCLVITPSIIFNKQDININPIIYIFYAISFVLTSLWVLINDVYMRAKLLHIIQKNSDNSLINCMRFCRPVYSYHFSFILSICCSIFTSSLLFKYLNTSVIPLYLVIGLVVYHLIFIGVFLYSAYDSNKTYFIANKIYVEEPPALDKQYSKNRLVETCKISILDLCFKLFITFIPFIYVISTIKMFDMISSLNMINILFILILFIFFVALLIYKIIIKDQK